MKRKTRTIRKYSIEDMNKLVFSILAGTEDTEEDLSMRIGRNKGYITQTRSRKQVTDKLMFLLEQEMEKKTAKSKPDLTVDEITMLRATTTYILREIALLKARAQGRPVEDVLDESEQNIHVILRDILKD